MKQIKFKVVKSINTRGWPRHRASRRGRLRVILNPKMIKRKEHTKFVGVMSILYFIRVLYSYVNQLNNILRK